MCSSDVVIRLESFYFNARENSRDAEVCAIVEDESSVAFEFQVRFIFSPDSASVYFSHLIWAHEYTNDHASPSILHSIS